MSSSALLRVTRDDWQSTEAAHHQRADALTAGRRHRAARGEVHPVDDFLFTYYSYKPGVLRKWHPGLGVELLDAALTHRADWRWYCEGEQAGSRTVDVDAWLADKLRLVRAIRTLLASSARRAAGFGCFGLHEWAMVYRDRSTRHDIPLRLGSAGTDAVVEAHELKCTHYDAFRFFSPEAAPLNREPLTRDDQARREQPGCLHAGMDLYKWAVKLGPLVSGALLLDTFELAREIRQLDMAASPYDVRPWGIAPVAIETPEGKAAYVRLQRAFTARTDPLRSSLIALCDQALAHAQAS